MTLRALIAGYYGAGNAGDEWILEALMGALRRRDPQAEARVLSYDPPATRRRHGVEAVGWGDLETLAGAVRWSTLVIAGGGGLWQDYWGFDPLDFLSGRPGGIAGYGTPMVLAHLLGRPSVLLGAGVGPLREPASRAAVRDLAALAGLVSVRDVASRDELIACGLPAERIHLGADLAFLSDTARGPASDDAARADPQPLLAVALRQWTFSGDPARWEAAIAAAVRQWCEVRDGHAVFVPLHESSQPLEDDRLIAERVAAQVGLPDRVRQVPTGLSPSERFAFLAAADVVLGMRYHSLVAALAAGVPCVGLAYDPKVRHLMDEAGCGDAVLGLEDLAAGKLAEVLIQAVDRPADHGCIDALRARAQVGLDRALELTNVPVQESPPPLLGEFVLSQSAHLAALESSLRQRFELPASYASRAEAGLAAIDTAAGRLGSAVRELEQVRGELEQARGELVQARSERVTAVNQVAQAEASVQVLTEQLRGLTRSVELQGARVRDAEAETGALRSGLAASASQLATLRSTKGVRFLNVYWRLRERLRPLALRVARMTGSLSRVARRIAELPFRRILFVVRHGLELPARLPPVYIYTDRTDLFSGYPLRRPLHFPERRSGVSLVVTMRNEATSARVWFDAILAQARLPDEVVIVDNGSTDGSAQLLTDYAQESSVPTRVVDGHGLSVGACRNLGVNTARFDNLAFTDLGCVPEQHWLGRLVIPLESDDAVSVSAGWYEVNPSPGQGQVLASDLVPSLDRIRPETFLPATRSLAMRREAWLRGGGFSEWLSYAGEDTLIDLRLKAHGEPWAFVPEAVVYWDPPRTLREYWHKACQWSKGDGESGAFAGKYWSRFIRLTLLTGGLTCGAFLGILGLALRVPPIAALGAVVGLLSVVGLATMSLQRGSPKAPTCVRLLGQVARTAGFLQGVAKRPQVSARRYSDTRRVILILAAVPWDDTGGGSRGAQLASEFVRRGDLVIYVYRFPKQESVDLHIPLPSGAFVHLPIEHFDWNAFEWEFGPVLGNRPRLAIVECPDRGFLPIILRWKKAGGKVVYDLIDDWTTSLGAAWFSEKVERAIVSEADLLTASAPSLVQRLDEMYQRQAFLLPNAVNLEMFDPSKDHTRPDDLPEGRFIAIYIGALWGEWFHWSLLIACARAYPEAAFVLIGDYRGQCPSPEPNLHFLGLKPQSSLPAYLAHSDIGFLPWRVTPITQATSPLKVYEYIAMGLPVVAPALPTLASLPLVATAADDTEFIRALENAQTRIWDVGDVQLASEGNGWNSRVTQVLSALGRGSGDASVPPSADQSPRKYCTVEDQSTEGSPGASRQNGPKAAGCSGADSPDTDLAGFPGDGFDLPLADRVSLHHSEYALESYRRGEEAVAKVLEFTKDMKGKRHLDIGSGHGGCCIASAKRGADALGVDLDEALVKHSLASLGEQPLGLTARFWLGDILDREFERSLGQFDVVTCDNVIEHVANPDGLMGAVSRLLAPDGLAYFTIPNGFSLGQVRADSHYLCFGVTLLDRFDAREYRRKASRDRRYDVGYYFGYAEYMEMFRRFGLSAVLLNSLDVGDDAMAALTRGVQGLPEELEDQDQLLAVLSEPVKGKLRAVIQRYAHRFEAERMHFEMEAGKGRVLSRSRIVRDWLLERWELILRKERN